MSKFGDNIFTQFDGTNIPENFNFPSIEIEDIDKAVFDLFDKQIAFEIEEKGSARKVPVIFAAGERFALTRRKNAIRDKNNALILPLISILRGEIDVSASQHNYGTAISYPDQPGYYIKKRLSKKDRKYQNLINKQQLKNQDNVAQKSSFIDDSLIYPGQDVLPDRIASRKNKGNNSLFSKKNIDLSNDMSDNIFEIIEVPYPKFMSIKYEVVFWCQYMQQANQMLQTVFRKYQGQGHEIAVKTIAGYELVAFFSKTFSLDSNFSDFTNEERMVKYAFGITIPGYMINPKSMKGIPNQLKSYISAPVVDFGYKTANNKIVLRDKNPIKEKDQNLNKNVLSDLNNINEVKDKIRGHTSEEIEFYEVNPFSKEKKVQFSKILGKNKRTGESIISPLIIKDIEKQNE
jgi:hypothetical protein